MSIKLSKPGVPVDVANDLNLVFDSTNPALMVHDIVNLENVTSPYTINHNLGYKPLAIGYGDYNLAPGDEQIVQLDLSIDENTITIHNDVQGAYIIIFAYKLE